MGKKDKRKENKKKLKEQEALIESAKQSGVIQLN